MILIMRGGPAWDSSVFLQLVTYRPTLRKFREGGGAVKKTPCTYESNKIPITKRSIDFVEQSYLNSSPFAFYGPIITVIQLSNLSTWAFPVFYKNILDGGITPDFRLIKVYTYITFESTKSMLSFERTLAHQRLGDHPIHLDIHFGQYFHLKILLGAIK